MRFVPVLPLALGFVCAQEASNIFEKAPPDVDEALRARISKFYQAFVQGKFRQADAFVAEDSKDKFFAIEKRQFRACQLATVSYSDHFTKAKAVTTCDTEYFMMGREIPIKRPITSEWILQDGEWYWHVVPISERTTIDTPFGPMKAPPPTSAGAENQNASPPPPARPDASSILQLLKQGVKVDRESIFIDPTKPSTEEIHVKNSMPGTVTLTADFGGIDGLSVKPAKVDIAAHEEATVAIVFDPEDPSIRCRECLSHPQSRKAGRVTLTVSTGQTFPIQVNYNTPAPGK